MSSGIQTVTETHAMCCICFEWVEHSGLWEDCQGQMWDVCQPCGDREALYAQETA